MALQRFSSKYISNFNVYCGRNLEANVRVLVCHDDPSLAQELILNLVENLYVISMNNYFFSISLFKELLLKGICAIGTMRINHIRLLITLANMTTFRKCK